MQTHLSAPNQHHTSHNNVFLKPQIVIALILTAVLSSIIIGVIAIKFDKTSLQSKVIVITPAPASTQSHRSNSSPDVTGAGSQEEEVLPVVSSSGIIVDNGNNTKSYTNLVHKYKVTYPSDWEIDTTRADNYVYYNGKERKGNPAGLTLSKNNIRWNLWFDLNTAYAMWSPKALNEKCHYNGTSSSCEWREDKKEFTILGLSGHKTVLVDKKTNEIYYVNFGSFYKGFGKVEDNIVQYFLEYDGDRLNNYMGELDSITSSLVKTE